MTLFMITGCNDDFLDRFPETSIGKENFFNTAEDLQIYINNLYDFPGSGLYTADAYNTSDNAESTGVTEIKTIMTTEASSSTIAGGWNWGKLRTINFFLENFDKANISEVDLNHFEGLARFFRARFYMNMVQRYSDVPWYETTLETDDEDLYKGRDSREMVVEKIFEDYSFAAEHVKENQLPGAVDKHVVLAFQARHALYEGTFRKYHSELNLQSTANSFIQLALESAKMIMDSGRFSIYTTGNTDSDYYSLFVSQDLTSNPEVILANIAIDNLKNSGNGEGIFGNYETFPAKDLVQAYLMADGTSYTNQEGYATKLFVEEFENRDARLNQTYAFPGWELVRTGTYAQGGGTYIQQLSKNFSGYHQIKGFVNETNTSYINDVDVPVLRYAEILLTYAEAKAELSQLTQADLDQTVNLLRSRVGMPAMVLGGSSDSFQRNKYPDVSDDNILEIRRERRVEMAMEGLRYDDLIRWNAGRVLEKEPEGLYFPGLGKYDLTGDGVEDIILISNTETVPSGEAKEKNSLGVDLLYYRAGEQGSDAGVYLNQGSSGTIATIRERGTFISPKHYYRPIPQTHVTVNPNLNQIFDWE